MNASTLSRYPSLARQAGVLRIEIAAVVMLFTALVIVMITHVPAHNPNPSTADAAPPVVGAAMIAAGHGAAAPLQQIAVPPSDAVGAAGP